MLPSSTVSPAASRLTPVGKGEVKMEVCASAITYSTAKTKGASLQRRSKGIRPHKLDAANDILRIILQWPPVNGPGRHRTAGSMATGKWPRSVEANGHKTHSATDFEGKVRFLMHRKGVLGAEIQRLSAQSNRKKREDDQEVKPEHRT